MFPYVGKDMEKLDYLCTAGGNINGAATLEKSLTVSYEVKHTFT